MRSGIAAGVERLEVAVDEGMSSVAVDGKIPWVLAAGTEPLSGDAAGLASESGGASEVWHRALSCSQKLTDRTPMANSAAFFFRILQIAFI